MERHKCKLCARSFTNGRALGGHMKAHLAAHRLPPKTITTTQQQHLRYGTRSASSSSSSSGDELELTKGKIQISEEKSLGYGLRNNPKKSFRAGDPEFDSGSAVVVQDRESETESRNPTRRRSKRNRKSFTAHHLQQPKLNKRKCVEESSSSPAAEPEPVSSVSDTSPEEDVAMCLMMLSRGRLMKDQKIVAMVDESEEIKMMIRGKQNRHRGDTCTKGFPSHHAFSGHKRVCGPALAAATETTKKIKNNNNAGKKAVVIDDDERIFECPFCYKVFGSGQALGGHKRSHLIAAAAISSTAAAAAHSVKWIDLNLPAPSEDDDFSVVSDG